MDCYPISLRRLRGVAASLFVVSIILCCAQAQPDQPSVSEPVQDLSESRWRELKEAIAYHDELYYRRAAPEISDAEYDALKREFLQLEAIFGGKEEASVGDDRGEGFAKARHLAPMLSLEKAYSESELRRFYDRVLEVSGADALRFSVEPKVDGMAVSVTYENGQFVRAVTRGDGWEGDDISENVLGIVGFPRTLAGGAEPRRIELRGEIFVSFEDFRKVNQDRLAANEAALSHPRSLAAGSAKLNDSEEVKGRRLSIVFFGVGGVEPANLGPASQAEFYEFADRWGLPVLPERREAFAWKGLLTAVEAMQRERFSYPYPTDGTVVKLDSFALQARLGESREAPHWALAYKSSGQLAETRLLAVNYQVGRTGVLTPVAELEAVTVSGSRIARASLHNFQEVERLDLRIGDSVFVEKAGEIIPQVVAVNFAKRDPASSPLAPPVRCPSCGGVLSQADGGAKIYCAASGCPERLKRRLEHYVSREALDFEGWGAATIGALVDAGRVKRIGDLYRVDREQLEEMAHVASATAERLLESREASRGRDMWRVIYGLGIPGVGEVRARRIAEVLGSLEDLGRPESLGLGPVERTALLGYLEQESNRREWEDLLSLDVCIQRGGTIEVAKVALFGKVFVFTGKLDSLTRAEASERVVKAGGEVRQTVSGKCDYLVVGSSPGRKLQEASRLGVAIIDEVEFLGLFEP
ncbi:NAD-dependent DNA ligase LigA [Pelagicoccus sp. SDUM812005]|uniref:NAD-dependent DNA ligase LigA n=1 Tax=Pelagicoccus sp. SDUM812005 TaxID=3041257 RepID=UPI00280E13D6|nr:NAD-dependent DNA ligase LigA [Pelagicoccus sp. SDUM812005]MDQ8180470.1 NAD-dependent DNA ligase LigA [Pelagicoccus sp. SDUM812005]